MWKNNNKNQTISIYFSVFTFFILSERKMNRFPYATSHNFARINAEPPTLEVASRTATQAWSMSLASIIGFIVVGIVGITLGAYSVALFNNGFTTPSIEVGVLNVTGYANITQANIGRIHTNFIWAAEGVIDLLNSTAGTITTFHSTTGTITTLSSTTGTITTLSSTTGTITNLFSTAGSITTLSSTTGTITNLFSTTGSITTLTSTTGTITNLFSTTGSITTLTSTTGTITNLFSTTGSITTLTSTTGSITTLTSVTGTITNLFSTIGSITTLSSTTANITNLYVVSGTIVTLTSTTGTITTLTSTTGTIASLYSTYANITSLEVQSFRQLPLTHTVNGTINAVHNLQYLDGGVGVPLLMTLSNVTLATMLDKEYRIFSKTTGAHNITLTGATWLPSGLPKATFPASIGAFLRFHVLSATQAVVTGTVGTVVFSS